MRDTGTLAEYAARLAGSAVAAELGYGVAWAGALRATPYVGLRYTNVTRAAYAENRVSGAVDHPIAYAAFHQRLGAAAMGLRLNGMVGESIGYQLGAGLDYYLSRSASPYAGTSEITDLETFALPVPGATRRATPMGSVALFHQIDRTQRLTGHVSMRGQAFSSQPTVSVFVGYQAAF